MSLAESGHSAGQASLHRLLAADKVTAQDSGLSVPDLIDRICIGGWPALLENSPAWAPHALGHSAAVLAHPNFVDPSLAVTALGQGPTQLLADLNATGYFFENLVVRDVRIYAQKLGGQVHHWRDQNQNEVDVVTLPDGRWGAFEVKMNPADADRAVAALLSFAAKVDQRKAGAPATLGSSPPPGSSTADPTASHCSASGPSAPEAPSDQFRSGRVHLAVDVQHVATPAADAHGWRPSVPTRRILGS